MNIRERAPLLAITLCLAVIAVFMVKTMAQEDANAGNSSGEQWEYLAVAGPSTTNFTPTSSPRMRKEPNSSFGREAFVLEQHLDKLGANGWELLAVAGPPNDPVYYFKRPKHTENSR